MSTLDTPNLLTALEGVAAWRDHAEEEFRARLAGLSTKEEQIRAQIAALEAQIAALDVPRAEISAKMKALDAEELRRSHDAVVATVAADRDLLEERAAKVRSRQADRRRQAEAMLHEPEVADAIRDFESFAQAEAGLAALPPSYRKAILDHHEAVRRRLAPVLQLVDGEAPPIDEETRGISIVASVDPMEGSPEALVFVLPVDAGVYNDWVSRGDDLAVLLAARIVAAAAEMVTRAGASDAPIAFRAFEGSLTIQIWLGSHVVEGDIKEIASALLDQVREEAREITAARLELYTIWLPPDVLNPPEEDPATAALERSFENDDDVDDSLYDAPQKEG